MKKSAVLRSGSILIGLLNAAGPLRAQNEHFERFYTGMPFGHVFQGITATADNDIVVGTFSAFGGFGLCRFDAHGLPQWMRTYSGGQMAGGQAMETYEERLMVLGGSGGFGFPENMGTVIMQADADGQPLWCRSYIAPGGSQPIALRPLIGGDVLLATSGSLARLSGTGTSVWWKNFQTRFSDAFPLADGSIVACGAYGLMKLSGDGDVLWSVGIAGDPEEVSFTGLLPRAQGVLACGTGPGAFWLAAFDEVGTLLWQRWFHAPADLPLSYRLSGLSTSNDGNTMLKVEAFATDNPQAMDFTFLLKCGADGAFRWAQDYTPNDELMASITSSFDASTLVASAFSTGESAIFRIDTSGYSGCSENGIPVEPLASAFSMAPGTIVYLSDSVTMDTMALTVNDHTLTIVASCIGITSVTPPLTDIGAVRAFPDPGSGRIEFTGLDAATVAHIRIVDPEGRVIEDAPLLGNAVDLSRFAPGLYTIVLQNGRTRSIHRCVLVGDGR